ncbi:MAG: hypothetical protein QME96_01530 [Myxococcota bacterium]|nr:hypothetical protein [Myxococcota bacterium]
MDCRKAVAGPFWCLCAAFAWAGCGDSGTGPGDEDAEDVEEIAEGDDYIADDGDRPDRETTGEDGDVISDDCGNGRLNDGEECDEGPANSNTRPDACRENCRSAHCGDCVRDTGEACDDCNTDETDGCLGTCRLSTCGNGRLDDGEECDDGNPDNDDDCLDTCLAARCGDGFVHRDREACDGNPPRSCSTGCDTTGTQACVACAWETGCAPPADICNGIDDDCAGGADDPFACVQGAVVNCATGCGSIGVGVCTAACGIPAPADCTPPIEVCNGIDDDCVGGIDQTFPCARGAAGSTCTTTCSSTGAGTCTDACQPALPADCTPPDEICNGIDDDCVGGIDQTFPCVRGAAGAPCTTTCSSTGAGTCTDACQPALPADCTPPAEICNGRDDDCDLLIDETFDCRSGVTEACLVGGCSGMRTCATDSCTWGSCDFGLPPANDACGVALTEVSGGGTFTGTTCAANNDYTYTCGPGGTPAASPDVLFRLTLPGTRNVVIDTVGTTFDALLFIRSDGACPGTTERRCDDNTAGGAPGQARIVWNTMPAGTYWIILDGAGAGNRGAYALNVAVMMPPPPPNDTCATALPLTSRTTHSGYTDGANDDHAPTCGGAGGAPDVWYTFTLGARELVYLDLDDGNSWNTILQVRRGPCATSTPVACNDDACGGARSQWFGALDPGTYYVVAAGEHEPGRRPVWLRRPRDGHRSTRVERAMEHVVVVVLRRHRPSSYPSRRPARAEKWRLWLPRGQGVADGGGRACRHPPRSPTGRATGQLFGLARDAFQHAGGCRAVRRHLPQVGRRCRIPLLRSEARRGGCPGGDRNGRAIAPTETSPPRSRPSPGRSAKVSDDGGRAVVASLPPPEPEARGGDPDEVPVLSSLASRRWASGGGRR